MIISDSYLFYVVLGYMFRSSLTIIRPVCESCFTNAGYILGSHYVYNYVSVYVGGRNSEWYKNYTWMLGALLRTSDCVSSGVLVFLLTCSLEDYGRSVSSGVIFYVGPVGDSGFVFLIIPTA